MSSDALERVSLADLLHDGLFTDGDWVETKDQDPDGDVRLIQLADIGDGVFRDRSARFLTMSKALELRCTFLEPSDVLVARMPEPLGRACLFPGVGQPAVTVVDVCVLRPNRSRVRADWLTTTINAPEFRSSMHRFVRGTTRQRISRKNLGGLELTLVDLDRQEEIALRVDRIAEATRRTGGHLDASRVALRLSRQAILTAACSGRMTKAWREINEMEPVRMALTQFVAHRANVPRGKKSPPFEPDTLPDLPDSWTWTDLDSLAADKPNALKAGPFGSSLTKAMYTETGFKVYGQEQVIAGDAGLDTYFIGPAKFAELKSCAVSPGEILISLVGTIGKTLILPEDSEPGVINPRLIRLDLDRALIHPEYMSLVLESPLTHSYYRRSAQGSTMEILNLQILRGIPIPLPPMDEQLEILDRASHYAEIVDAVTLNVARCRASVERSSGAVLSKAFRGELLQAPS
jgi:type I restriction enzyme S subunit